MGECCRPIPTLEGHRVQRQGHLFSQISGFSNLLAAAKRAYRGKRKRAEPAHFHFHLETHLLQLQQELLAGTYRPGAYHAFRIREPKPRLISAAPYRDRVVHHAVCRIIEPIFERTFIFDSYATRVGKGTHRALDRCTYFCRRYRYVLKCDIEKYFPSMDHAILLTRLARKIKCADTLRLLHLILTSSNPQEPIIRYFPGDDLLTPVLRRQGIPIGNLTSQFFGNVMLDPLDHWVKETLRCKGYLRYMDDFLVFGNDKAELHALLEQIRVFLQDYRLTLHPRKCMVMRVADGVPFLGWQVFADHRRIRRPTGVRFQRRLRALQALYRSGDIGLAEIQPSIASWLGHLKHGDTLHLRRKLLGHTVFQRDADSLHSLDTAQEKQVEHK
jgi:RNA-directed DNA polymerase